jgi:hypothetical protein
MAAMKADDPQLAVLPGEDHFGPVAQANLVARMVKEFFEAPMPKVTNKPAEG